MVSTALPHQSGHMRMAIHCVAANALLFRDIPWVAAADLKAIRLWSSMPAVTKRKPNSLVRRTPATVFTCPRLAADKLTTTLKARQISSQQEVHRLTKLLDFPDMELVAQRTFELQVHLVTNARSRRLYYLPCQVGVRGFVSQC